MFKGLMVNQACLIILVANSRELAALFVTTFGMSCGVILTPCVSPKMCSLQ